MGDWGNNYCHHEKKADSREREGRGQRGHVTSGVRVQGLPAHPTKGRGRPKGTNETCHRGVSQWSTGGCVASQECALLRAPPRD